MFAHDQSITWLPVTRLQATHCSQPPHVPFSDPEDALGGLLAGSTPEAALSDGATLPGAEGAAAAAAAAPASAYDSVRSIRYIELLSLMQPRDGGSATAEDPSGGSSRSSSNAGDSSNNAGDGSADAGSVRAGATVGAGSEEGCSAGSSSSSSSDANGVLLLDVRSKGEFGGGHVPGALNVPLDELRGSVAKSLALEPRPLVVIGSGDVRSAQACVRLARVFGAPRVMHFEAGTDGFAQIPQP